MKITTLRTGLTAAIALILVVTQPGLAGPPVAIAPDGLAGLCPNDGSEAGTVPVPVPRIESYGNSGCLLDADGEVMWPCGEDEFDFRVEGSTLQVAHRNATYNCCPDDIVITLYVDQYRIVLTEQEDLASGGCDCWCCYETEATVVDLPPGTYAVEFWWFDYEPWQMQCHVDEIVVSGGGDPPRHDPPVPVEPGALQTNGAPDAGVGTAPHVDDYANSGCRLNPEGDPVPCEDPDEFELTVEPYTLHMLHRNANYNCCLDDIAVLLEVEGNVLHLTEVEICPDPCYCICCFEVEATVVDLTPGPYTVEICWYDHDTNQIECYVEDVVIPSDGGKGPPRPEPPVPVEPGSVQPGEAPAAGVGLAQPHVDDYANSGCLLGPEGDPWPCEDPDEVTLTVDGHTLHILHTNANYNCCPDDIVISLLDIGEGLLRLYEEEILTLPCWCICCYTVEGTVVDLPSGDYLVEFCWFDYDTDQVECHVEQIVVP
jgi:hypothetical protein